MVYKEIYAVCFAATEDGDRDSNDTVTGWIVDNKDNGPGLMEIARALAELQSGAPHAKMEDGYVFPIPVEDVVEHITAMDESAAPHTGFRN
jgi:hypothetical protein